MSRLMRIPAFKFVDGEKEIAAFDSYAELYSYCEKEENKKLMGTILGYAELIMLFGEVPLKYDLKDGRLYALGWREVK